MKKLNSFVEKHRTEIEVVIGSIVVITSIASYAAFRAKLNDLAFMSDEEVNEYVKKNMN